MPPARNAPCPCGSGVKFKRCCGASARDHAAEVRRDERVGRETENWALANFGDEFRDVVGQVDRDLDGHPQGDWILLHWLLLDRELSGGGTPAQRYAALPQLSDADREVAVRIAAARPGIHRVIACEPGHALELEDVLRGGRIRVHSDSVSRAAAIWDVLVARVMAGPRGASLWGPTAFFAFDEENELLEAFAALGRDADLEQALRRHWRELITFTPPSRDRPLEVLTAEGDPLVDARAAWSIADDEAVFERLEPPLEYVGEDDDRADVFEWLIPRSEAMASRPIRGKGTAYLEATFPDHPGMVSVATLRLYADELVLSTFSERRLDGAIALIAEQLRGLARLDERDVAPLDHDATPTATPSLDTSDVDAIEQHLAQWLDTPLACLDGLSPRAAGPRPEHHDELERLLRGIENRAARAHARREPWPSVAFVRRELGFGDDALAA